MISGSVGMCGDDDCLYGPFCHQMKSVAESAAQTAAKTWDLFGVAWWGRFSAPHLGTCLLLSVSSGPKNGSGKRPRLWPPFSIFSRP